jgi:integrase
MMDRTDWLRRMHDEPDWQAWAVYLSAADTLYKGTRTVWALNLLEALCKYHNCEKHPELMPAQYKVLRAGIDHVLAGKKDQQVGIGYRMLHAMVCADSRCTATLAPVFPRRRRKVPVDPVRRQRARCVEDALPRAVKNTWVAELLAEIMDHPASRAWKNSATAHQSLSLVHRFLRCAELLRFRSLGDFKDHIKQMSVQDVESVCLSFTDKYCKTHAAAKRYLVVFNHIFHKVWGVLKEKYKAHKAMKRTYSTLQEMAEVLSQTTGTLSDQGAERNSSEEDYFTAAETERLFAAAGRAENPHRIRDELIVSALLSTGLRCAALLNMKIRDVATLVDDENDSVQRWVANDSGTTSTKGMKTFTFLILTGMRLRLSRWLNTPERDGGRPCCASPYVFPSALLDMGQLSPSSLGRIFRDICHLAKFDLANDPRCHLHAMRHTYAHALEKASNSVKQISVAMGHKSVNVTSTVYLRESRQALLKGITAPDLAGVEESGSAPAPPDAPSPAPTSRTSAKKKKAKKRVVIVDPSPALCAMDETSSTPAPMREGTFAPPSLATHTATAVARVDTEVGRKTKKQRLDDAIERALAKLTGAP